MSAEAFRARYAAYSLDLLLLSPLAIALAWRPLQAAVAAWRALENAMLQALDRAFAAGHFALLDLAAALRADARFAEAMAQGIGAVLGGLAGAGLLAWALALLWFVGFEASRWQATPGKRALGLRVTALDGGAPGIARLLLRFLAAGPSWLLLHLGHALVLFREDGRAGHDLVAGTRVAGDGGLPAWAQAWLGLQAAAVLVLLAWMAWTMARAAVLIGL